MRWFANIVVLLPLLVGVTPRQIEPNDPRLKDCPFAVDPNLIVGRLLACVRAELGQPLLHTRTWHDPDGDLAQVRILQGPAEARIVNRPKTGSYTIVWTPRQTGITAIVVQVTDQPAHGRPKSDVGTILVQVVPRGLRLAPHGCGGPPQ